MMGPTLITIGSDASVAQALELARSNQVHHLPVLSGSALVGLMCTCDVRDAAPESLVAQRMSQPPVTLDASATLVAAAKTMQDRRVGSVIITVDGQARGIVTRGDLLRVQPSTEDILWNGRCECCGLTRHLSTGPGGRTLCMYCLEDPPQTQRSQLAPQPDRGFEFSPSPIPAPRPLESLIREHRLIGKLAQALSNFSECFAFQPTPDDRDDLAKFARVFRELGDCMHHEKEETVLLPLLAHLGFDWEDGPIAEVRQEHCQERYLIDVLCQAAEREGDWSEDERRRVCATASALAEFQRTHLHKENTVLFPVILQRLSANEQRLLESELHIFDLRIDRYMPRGELTALAEDLVRRYLPSLLADSAVVECGLSALVVG
jgi:hemerythrin-like domain-containing protein